MRCPEHYLQHPDQIKLELLPIAPTPQWSDPSLPLGLSMLSFRQYIPGKWLRITAPEVDPCLGISALVVECLPAPDHQGQFELKLAFPDQEQLFRARMLEQLCQICICQQDSPEEDPEKLALEWIESEAAHFPSDGL
ncbi:hypothetical protein H9C73_10230 [Marinobacterium sp. AK62]|uniref:PilZ domain-containing protein n=1 Tax=Marinobacterium alkalitolerans TaxID=1542925 RepID=A0ABS3ZBM6_9GAMM|nr:hypothetical protein [Marinobacterium alkalitolerans]MBP0049115.1 hypothetical protein [Marinobacterium alkalitolerans]